MSDNNQNPPPKPGGPQPDRFQPKLLIIWIVIILSMLLLWSVSSDAQSASFEPTMREVLTMAKEDQLTAVKIKANPGGGEEFYVVSGEAKNPEYDPQNTAENAPKETRPFRSEGYLTPENRDMLLSTVPAPKAKEEPASTFLQNVLLTMLPFLIIIGLLYFFFVRQLKMAGKGAMSFGKSRAKMLQRDRDRIVFKDVAGCDEAKEEVSEIVDFLKDPKKFQRIGGKVPKGVLMVGPPGTGKTLLAKAVAGEADVPFFSISGSDFVEMFVGVGAARVRDMFEQGRKNAPCIVFIDEIDAVGRQRGAGVGGGNDEREQTLNSLLVEMDGFDGHEGVIIVAATNRPDVLDRALLRPGRFDRQINVDLPDLQGREEVLKVHAKKIKMSRDVDLNAVARATPGMAGADLANILNESALIAARHGKDEVEMADIEEARDKISFGRERRRLMDAEDKRMTAYHEAGHALVQAYFKDDKQFRLHKVTIIPRGGALGITMSTPTKDILGYGKKQLLNRLAVCMAGRIGEEYDTGEFSNGAANDLKQATEIARHMVCEWGMSNIGQVALGDNQDQIFLGREITRSHSYSESTAEKVDEEIKRILDEAYAQATKIIQDHQEELEKIADALLKYETIDGKHVYEILEHGDITSPVVLNPTKTAAEREAEREEERKKKAKDDKGEDLGPGMEPAGTPA